MLLDARLLRGRPTSFSRSAARPRTWPSRHRSSARERRHQAQVGAELAARGVERARPAPEAQEHVLDDVLGQRRVAEDAERGGVDAAVVLGEGAPEGLRVAQIHAVITQRYTPC